VDIAVLAADDRLKVGRLVCGADTVDPVVPGGNWASVGRGMCHQWDWSIRR